MFENILSATLTIIYYCKSKTLKRKWFKKSVGRVRIDSPASVNNNCISKTNNVGRWSICITKRIMPYVETNKHYCMQNTGHNVF